MSAQGWSAATTLGQQIKKHETLKGFVNRRTLSGFSVYFGSTPKVVAMLQPWAEISERLRRTIRISQSLFNVYAYSVPLPSTTLRYFRIGGLVSLSVRPLGHLISMLSIFVAAPIP